ncbi:PA24B phospholipase, partial [Erythrocercus mccallii]|nr:PA24B phospholipase [Erythrocercus mccallii]
LDVRLGFDLCIQEQDFLCKRKNYVIPALKKVLQLEQDLLDHETPVVAVMTTGGGMRSLTALYGSLRGLKKLNVLDCAAYLTGLSGTTCILKQYYSLRIVFHILQVTCLEIMKLQTLCMPVRDVNKRICRILKGVRSSIKLQHNTRIITISLESQKDNHRLSDQQQAIDRGQNPLPIYTAVNVKNNYSTLDFKEWVEFTPYEVGLQKYGVFVRTEDFGSEFFMGRLMKKVPESRICFLEG